MIRIKKLSSKNGQQLVTANKFLIMPNVNKQTKTSKGFSLGKTRKSPRHGEQRPRNKQRKRLKLIEKIGRRRQLLHSIHFHFCSHSLTHQNLHVYVIVLNHMCMHTYIHTHARSHMT